MRKIGKKLTKTSAFTVCAAIALFAGACGSANKPVDTVEGDHDPFGKYEQTVTLSVGITKDSTITSQVLPYLQNENLRNNRYTDLYSDLLNVEFDYKWEAASDEDYENKVSAAMASGNLPDVIMTNKDTIQELYEAGQLKDVSDVWDEYASPLLKQITTQEGNGDLNAVTYGGKLYAIPQVYSSIDRAQFIWIRMDWLEKLNSEKGMNLSKNPQTVDDLVAIIKAFKDNYVFLTTGVAGNESANATNKRGGLVMMGDAYSDFGGWTGFLNSYGAYPSMWLEQDDGSLTYGSVKSEVKTALAKLNELYTGGYIYQEFSSRSVDDVATALTNGYYGVVYGEQWLCSYPFQQIYNQDQSVDWQAFPIVGVSASEKAKPQVTSATYGWWGVTQSCANPEAIIKIMNVYVEAVWGDAEYTDFDTYYSQSFTTAGGSNISVDVWKLSLVKNEPPRKNLQAYLDIKAAKAANDFTMLTGEAKTIYGYIQDYLNGNKGLWSWYNGYWPNEDANTVFEQMNYYVQNDLILLNKFTGAQTETMRAQSRMTLIENKANEIYTSMIMAANASAFNACWDELQTFYSNYGGAKITNEVNLWYSDYTD